MSRRGGPDRFLHVKVGIFFVAAGFLVVAMLTEETWPAAVAIAVAAAGLLLRFLPRRGDGADG